MTRCPSRMSARWEFPSWVKKGIGVVQGSGATRATSQGNSRMLPFLTHNDFSHNLSLLKAGQQVAPEGQGAFHAGGSS